MLDDQGYASAYISGTQRQVWVGLNTKDGDPIFGILKGLIKYLQFSSTEVNPSAFHDTGHTLATCGRYAVFWTTRPHQYRLGIQNSVALYSFPIIVATLTWHCPRVLLTWASSNIASFFWNTLQYAPNCILFRAEEHPPASKSLSLL